MRPVHVIIIMILILLAIPLFFESLYLWVGLSIIGLLFCIIVFKVFNRNIKHVSFHEFVFSIILMCLITLPTIIISFVNYIDVEPRSKKIKWHDVIVKPGKTVGPVINDHFLLRKRFIRFYNHLMVFKVGISPMPERVLLGRQGSLVYSGENVIEDYRSTIPFSRQQLEKIRKALEKRNEYLRQKGIKHYLFIAPNMHTIYPENLPGYIKRIGMISRFDQLIDFLGEKSNVKIIDVRGELLKRKRSDALWYKTDTHWNDLGAFVAYNALIREIKNDIPIIKPLREDDFKKTAKIIKGGDLAGMLDLSDCFKEKSIFMVPDSFQYSYERGDIGNYTDPSPGRTIIMNHKNSRLPRMAMFRDSFAEALVPYLSQNFSRSAYFWTPRLITEIVEKEKPDVVITEVTERYIWKLAD